MPWREVCPMEQKMRFIAAAMAEDESMAALCEEFGVSRKTGYKWLRRYQGGGAGGALARTAAGAVGDQSGAARGDRGRAPDPSELGAEEA